ncbi:MAG: TIGR02996 domain-containing protein [Deltaproteobacteria bacterium]|nr:TIGR02996 domain-containing protein [Deltaproteobacteria bacterium]
MARGANKVVRAQALEDASATHLEAAADAAERDAWALACDALAAAWHVHPSRRVVELVAILDDRAPHPPIDARTVAEREALWSERAASLDPAHLSALLATPWPAHPVQAFARVAALELWPRSPRIANALFAVHARRLYTSSTGRKLSRRIFQVLLAHGDPTVTAYLDRLERDLDLVDRAARSMLAGIMRRRRPEEPTPSPREAAALVRLEQIVRRAAPSTVAASRDELLAAIYAAPFDDGPRAVLADLLLEAGDPRGELITLQLEHARPANAQRERAMLRQAGNTWFDGLDKVGASDITLARGFPVAATTRTCNFDGPAWATIESLAIDPLPGVVFRGAPVLRGLRALHGVNSLELRGVVLPDPAALDVLGVVGGAHGLADLTIETALAPRVLGLGDLPPRVTRHWTDRVGADLGKLASAPLGRRITQLDLAFAIDELAVAFELLAAAPQLETITIAGSADRFARDPRSWSARVTRQHLRLEWTTTRWNRITIDHLIPVLDRLRTPTVETVEIVVTGRVASGELARVLQHVSTIIARWPATRVVSSR